MTEMFTRHSECGRKYRSFLHYGDTCLDLYTVAAVTRGYPQGGTVLFQDGSKLTVCTGDVQIIGAALIDRFKPVDGEEEWNWLL